MKVIMGLLVLMIVALVILLVVIHRKERREAALQPPKRWELVRRPGEWEYKILDTKNNQIPSRIEGRFNWWGPSIYGGPPGLAVEFVDYLNAKEPPPVGSPEWLKLEAMKELDQIDGGAS